MNSASSMNMNQRGSCNLNMLEVTEVFITFLAVKYQDLCFKYMLYLTLIFFTSEKYSPMQIAWELFIFH